MLEKMLLLVCLSPWLWGWCLGRWELSLGAGREVRQLEGDLKGDLKGDLEACKPASLEVWKGKTHWARMAGTGFPLGLALGGWGAREGARGNPCGIHCMGITYL